MRSNACPAGWGVVVGTDYGGKVSLVEEIYGPVEINPNSPRFMGAEYGNYHIHML